MVTQITKGIKISVKTKFNGTSLNRGFLYYAFSYTITIENQSTETMQLINRHWTIFDTLNTTTTVDGDGVVGQTPTLNPNESYTYSSGCYLNATIGAMKGHYTMLNHSTLDKVKVPIPTFQLINPPLLN